MKKQAVSLVVLMVAITAAAALVAFFIQPGTEKSSGIQVCTLDGEEFFLEFTGGVAFTEFTGPSGKVYQCSAPVDREYWRKTSTR